MEIDLRDAVCFDTETSGLDSTAEICSISILDFRSGVVLFDRILKTKNPIPDHISTIHGITNKESQQSHKIGYFWDYITKNLLANKVVLGYNVFFDIRMLFQSYSIWEPEQVPYFNATCVVDVMQMAKIAFNEEKWLSLSAACKRAEMPMDESKAHGSSYDALMTINLFKKLVRI